MIALIELLCVYYSNCVRYQERIHDKASKSISSPKFELPTALYVLVMYMIVRSNTTLGAIQTIVYPGYMYWPSYKLLGLYLNLH